ncbi:hypothetical protein V8G54_007570 [Vigna mungo]|uniref:SHSP domain-containing protein n=1 Tax=Vigna mungo TaxID=3915 RepID=A0AAQ3P2J8_VIGMU
MAATPADVRENPNSYMFVMDMPGMKLWKIKVQVEDHLLTVNGERKREEKEGTEYLKMERRMGKFMRKFPLPHNSNAIADVMSALYQDGVFTVTVKKLPPPEPKKPKLIEIEVKID